MKIIQILPELNAGGVEQGTLEIGEALVEAGHESIVISNGGQLTEKLEREGSRHITLPVHKKRLSSLRQIKNFRRIFEEESPDVIHLRSRLPAWLAYIAWYRIPKSARPKLITTVHGFYSVNAYSAVMTKGQQVICVSDSVKEYVQRNYPSVPPKKLTVIHRGVAMEEFPHGFHPPKAWIDAWTGTYPQLERKFVVTLPGRITRWKGQLDFLQVITKLKSMDINVHGIIAGAPHPKKLDYFQELKSAINSTGLGDDITLIGHRSDLREVMAVSDAVVSCSTVPEAFGRVSLEALSLGKPVAGYAHGGVREQLEAILPSGLIPAGNIEEMAKLLASWEARPPSPEMKDEFSLAAMQAKTLEIYESQETI